MKAISAELKHTTSLGPAARTASANGTGVDLANQSGCEVLFIVGTVTDGTHTPSLEESDALGSGYAAVAAADQVGTLAALASNVNQKVGYIGKKRYVRAVITASGTTTGAVDAAIVITEPKKKPQTT